jgi:hypothetical protein
MQTKPSSNYKQEEKKKGNKRRVRETEIKQKNTSLENKKTLINLNGHKLFKT